MGRSVEAWTRPARATGDFGQLHQSMPSLDPDHHQLCCFPVRNNWSREHVEAAWISVFAPGAAAEGGPFSPVAGSHNHHFTFAAVTLCHGAAGNDMLMHTISHFSTLSTSREVRTRAADLRSFPFGTKIIGSVDHGFLGCSGQFSCLKPHYELGTSTRLLTLPFRVGCLP
ncbi:hypothetical protein VTK26DRAFT_5243 [Humicola hyalothermophila]